MATTTGPITRPKGKPRVGGGGGNNGFKGNGGGPGGPGGPFRPTPGDPFRIGLWLAIGGVAMIFGSLTAAFFYVRFAQADKWQPFQFPKIVWVNTALLVISSITIELARQSLKRSKQLALSLWLALTLALGLGFLGGQLLAWQQLSEEGLFLGRSIRSSFFYVLTGTHGAHLIIGVLGLIYVIIGAFRHRFTPENRSAVDLVRVYWHFMDALWVYLFLLLVLVK